MPENLDDFILGEPQAQEQKSEGWLPYLGRQAISGLEKVAEIPLGIHEAGLAGSRMIRSALPIAQQLPQPLGEQLPIPTTEQFRAGAEKQFGYNPGSFTPEGALENIGQEAIKFGATAGLGSAISSASKGQGLASSLGAGAQTIKETAKPIIGSAIGGQVGESIGDIFKLPEPVKGAMNLVGSLIGGSYGTRSKVIQQVDKNYDLARKNLPETASFQSPGMAKVVESLERKAFKLPGYEKAEPIVEKFRNLLQNENRVPIQDALDFKIALNAEYNKYPKKIRDQIITPMINSLKNDVIIPYGKELNQDFLKPWMTAEKDFSALKNRFVKTDVITDQIEKIIEKYPDQLTSGAKKAVSFILGGTGYYFNPTATFLVGVPAFGLNEIDKFSGLISKSTTAQKLLKETIKQLSLGHSANAIKLLNKLDKELPELTEELDEDFILG